MTMLYLSCHTAGVTLHNKHFVYKPVLLGEKDKTCYELPFHEHQSKKSHACIFCLLCAVLVLSANIPSFFSYICFNKMGKHSKVVRTFYIYLHTSSTQYLCYCEYQLDLCEENTVCAFFSFL